MVRLYNTVHANGKQPRREGGRRGASFLLPPIIPRVFVTRTFHRRVSSSVSRTSVDGPRRGAGHLALGGSGG